MQNVRMTQARRAQERVPLRLNDENSSSDNLRVMIAFQGQGLAEPLTLAHRRIQKIEGRRELIVV
ncbi:hypothetical protein [Paracoccus sp. NFXS7]|uniref:hypothetical protein n=1 Tax=Paracoccus sp. NFXS7 TaxID=2908653 RepID=UPI0032E03027